jgi:hypothetical protein
MRFFGEAVMSIETALIARARPQILQNMRKHILQAEASKGCSPNLSPEPVALEPAYQPIWKVSDLLKDKNLPQFVPERPSSTEALVRQEIWIPPDHSFDIWHAERFLKQLCEVQYRVGLEIFGNQEAIHILLLSHEKDHLLVKSAFEGEFVNCALADHPPQLETFMPPQLWANASFRDYFPLPPYSHLLTRPDELHSSPYDPLLISLAKLPPPSVGFCQVLFQPVSPEHNWHQNVKNLLDLEFYSKLNDGTALPQRYAMQSPSGDLHTMSNETENKAHNDKPFFAVALRIGLASPEHLHDDWVVSLSRITGLFLHGGRPLDYLTESEYSSELSNMQARNLFLNALTYRPGFLVNSLELAGLVHLPTAAIIAEQEIPLPLLEKLIKTNSELSTGTPIGEIIQAGRRIVVCIPETPRTWHTHILGKTDLGKTRQSENMALDDAEKGSGVAVIDPHGGFVDRMLRLIREEDVERTIYFNPSDPDWVPLWNPLARLPGQDISRTSSELVAAIKTFVGKDSWGDRMENILRNLLFSVMHMPGANLMDVMRLLYNRRKSNKEYIEALLPLIENESVRIFWKEDFKKYRPDELSPPKNKLSKLLVSEHIAPMLSQPESRFNLREIMDTGKILLIDLSGTGPTSMHVLGCLFLALLHLSALGRSNVPDEQRRDFHIYCDEAHLFLSDSYASLISETRKFRVFLTLAHQSMSQFDREKVAALGGVGTTIFFNVDAGDANYLVKNSRGLVKVDDLSSLKPREFIARIGTEIVRSRTRDCREISATNFRDRIIEQSRKRYYKRRSELMNNSGATQGTGMEFPYDEFE